MKNFIRLYSFFLLFTVTSCSNKSNGDVVIKPSVKENAKPLTLKEVPGAKIGYCFTPNTNN